MHDYKATLTIDFTRFLGQVCQKLSRILYFSFVPWESIICGLIRFALLRVISLTWRPSLKWLNSTAKPILLSLATGAAFSTDSCLFPRRQALSELSPSYPTATLSTRTFPRAVSECHSNCVFILHGIQVCHFPRAHRPFHGEKYRSNILGVPQ
jgi:hypothetical protein